MAVPSKSKVFMNLYLVERLDAGGYDSYSEFVICCANDDFARNTHPDEGYEWYKSERYMPRYNSWVQVDAIDTLKVTLLGQASPDLEPGVIISSFHAG